MKDRFKNPWTMVPGWLSSRSDLDKDQLIVASTVLSLYCYKQVPIKVSKEFLWNKISSDKFTADSMVTIENVLESLVDKGIILILSDGKVQAGKVAYKFENESLPKEGKDMLEIQDLFGELLGKL